MRLADIMSSPVETIPATGSVALARTAMKRRGVHHLVIADGPTTVGIVCAHDLKSASSQQPVTEVMSGELVSASPRTTVREAANLLRGRRVSCVPVLDRGRVVGMVSIADLLDLLGRGVERPVARSTRWTLKARGPRKSRPSEDRSRTEHTR